MKRVVKIIVIVIIIGIVLVALAGMYKFNYLASKPGYDVDGNKIKEVQQEDFLNKNISTLNKGKWKWAKTQYNNDTEIKPLKPNSFVAEFSEKGQFFSTTDCNSISGSYTEKQNSLVFGPVAMTKKFCPDSQEQEYVGMLEEVEGYMITSEGDLVLLLKFDTGSMVFKPVGE